MTIVEKVSPVYSIGVTPMATPRPRARIVRPKGKKEFVSIYNDPDYMNWKKELAIKISNLRIPVNEWNTINVTFFIPLSESTRKNRTKSQRMHGTLHQQKPDWDNYIKAFMDALQYSDEDLVLYMPITDDSVISSGVVRKVWIDDPIGKIVFTLAKISIDPLLSMAV
jgi:Holliday junction resolvase RusA-like endonuclease